MSDPTAANLLEKPIEFSSSDFTIQDPPPTMGAVTEVEGFNQKPVIQQEAELRRHSEVLADWAVATGVMDPTDVARFFPLFVEQFIGKHLVDLDYAESSTGALSSSETTTVPVFTGEVLPSEWSKQPEPQPMATGPVAIEPNSEVPPIAKPTEPLILNGENAAPPPASPLEPETSSPNQAIEEPYKPSSIKDSEVSTNRRRNTGKPLTQRGLKRELDEIKELQLEVLYLVGDLGAEGLSEDKLREVETAYSQFTDRYVKLYANTGNYTRSIGWLFPLKQELHEEIQGLEMLDSLEDTFQTGLHERLYQVSASNTEAADHAVVVAENVQAGLEVADKAATVATIAAGPGSAIARTGTRQGYKLAFRQTGRFVADVARDEAISQGRNVAVDLGVHAGLIDEDRAEEIKQGLELIDQARGQGRFNSKSGNLGAKASGPNSDSDLTKRKNPLELRTKVIAVPANRRKPPNAPLIDRWVNHKKGKVEFLPEGTKYTDWEGNSVIYRNDMDPDFKQAGFVEKDAEIEIPNMVGDRGRGSMDYNAAREALQKKGIPEERIEELFDPLKYQVHHVEDQRRIQFVNAKIHRRFSHKSAVSDIKNDRAPRTYNETQ